MHKIFLSFFFSLSLTFLSAQQNHFVYLQTYNNQPFYLRFNSKVLSSSSTGYLIIPKLSNGNYQLIIGFARNEWPEQFFNISVKANTGFELKNFGDRGWGLYDLQNAQVIMGESSAAASATPAVSVPKKNDAFAEMLSNVVNDSTIRMDDGAIAKKNTSKPPVEENKKVVANVPANDQPVTTVSYSTITRNTENITDDAMERVYTDNTGATTDTIRILIPLEPVGPEKNTEKIIAEEKKPAVESKTREQDPVTITDNTSKTKDAAQAKSAAPVFIEDTPDKTDKPATIKTEQAESKPGKLALANSDCRAIASEDDFLRLRKRMAAEKTDEDMIKVAKKVLKLKCFNTVFVKNLGALFLSDKGKYNFFDTAYPFVTDSQNFPSLERELSDDYYINRFRAMIHK